MSTEAALKNKNQLTQTHQIAACCFKLTEQNLRTTIKEKNIFKYYLFRYYYF